MSRAKSVHISLLLLAGAFLAAPATADTITVCCHGTGDFETIQDGIDAAVDGDTVLALDGTYSGEGNRDVDFGGRLITVCSENGPDNCIIDCEASDADRYRAFTFQNGEGGAAVLEGFTIINGYKVRGGAILCMNASVPTIRHCVFRDNTAQGDAVEHRGYGGAISCRALGGATIAQCAFVGNTAEGGPSRFTGRGGALACYEAGEVTIDSCVFRDNSAIAHTERSGQGGAIFSTESEHLTITGCQFVGNAALASGHYLGGLGGAMMSAYGSVTVVNSGFVGNRVEGTGVNAVGGAWHPTLDTEALVLNCTFAGNAADFNGGAVCPVRCTSIWWVNCRFIGNTAGESGGVFSCRSPNAYLVNCTLAGNHAAGYGGALYGDTLSSGPAPFVVQNCILWGNDAPLGPQGYVETTNGPATLAVSYSDAQGGVDGFHVDPNSELIWGNGNIDADPLFVGGPTGTWTADSDPNEYEATGQTTFFDDSAAWITNQLAGKFLQPNTGLDPNDPERYLQSLIVSNTATSVTVWGNFAALGTTGASYQLNDYHVMSSSPVIDAGDDTAVPADDLDLDRDSGVTERIPLDADYIRRFTDRPATGDTGIADEPNYPQVVDMGAYEYGTFGDLGGDCSVALADLVELLASYGATVGVGYDHGDLNLDEEVSLLDLAALLAVYGTTCE